MEKVSVIIATYRREAVLGRAIESVLAQSYPEVELIVVDDNANAEWNEKVRAIVEKYPTVVYLCNEQNKGSAETRNVGLRAATGTYVTFLDDDDVYLCDKVKNQAEFMQENELDYSVTDIDLYYEDGTLCENRTRSYIKSTDADSLLRYHLLHHIAGTPTMMFRRDYIFKIGCFGKIDVGEDFYLFHKAIEGGGKFGYLPRSDIKAFVHTAGEGLSIGESKIQGENCVYAYIKRYFGKLTRAERRYIRMRHYAVLAFAYLRKKQLVRFFLCGVRSALCAPVACIKLLLNQKKRDNH